MNFLKKTISAVFILAIAFIDVKIIVDFEIIKPIEKYSIIDQKKTVAEVLDLSSIHPEKIFKTEEIVEDLETAILEETETNVVSSEMASSASQPENLEEKVAESFEEIIVEEPEMVSEVTEQPEVSENSNETSENVTVSEETSSTSADSIVETALQYKGYSYVSGGASPETGFDCSGFTKYIYGLFGINLNRVSADQAENGTPISKEELQPGDLVLFSYYGSDSIGHSGIYIGDGKFIHAANSNRGVVIDTLESGYYLENYVTARRLF